MKTPKYWRDREESWQSQQIKDDKQRMSEIKKRMQQAQDEIQKEIDSQWQNFSDGEMITILEARKRASKMDVEKFASKAKRYVKNKDFSSEANRTLKLYNLTMRVNRLELLKANIGLELISLFNDLNIYFNTNLRDIALEEFKRQSGILGLYTPKNGYDSLVDKIVNNSIQDRKYPTFSQSLWQYQSELKADLDKILVRGITQGKNPKTFAKELKALMTDAGKENATFNANRLLISETTKIQSDVQSESYENAGIDEYEYIAEPSACKICSELDGKVFKTKDKESGVNAPGMHPFCKCSTAPRVDDRAFWDDLLRRKVISKDEYKQAFDDRAEANEAIEELIKKRKK